MGGPLAQQKDHSEPPRDIRHELVMLLLEKVYQDPYPSTTMLDLLEEIVDSDERADLAAVLMDKILGDRFPSLDMMSRVRDLV